MTTDRSPANLRSLVLRAWWDGQEHPSIECPVGDFFGFAHGKVMPYHSAVHSVGPHGRDEPLAADAVCEAGQDHVHQRGRQDSSNAPPVFYQIDYTLGRQARRRRGPAARAVPPREPDDARRRISSCCRSGTSKGRFIGSVIGIRNLHPDQWWGEGEIKVYMDGDKEFPTICGTGSEDYVGLAWGIQQTPFLYNGCSLNQKNFVSMYRWHLPDPIAWQKECRITIQQIACKNGLAETQDDWSCATFWYEPVPSAPLPQDARREGPHGGHLEGLKMRG